MRAFRLEGSVWFCHIHIAQSVPTEQMFTGHSASRWGDVQRMPTLDFTNSSQFFDNHRTITGQRRHKSLQNLYNCPGLCKLTGRPRHKCPEMIGCSVFAPCQPRHLCRGHVDCYHDIYVALDVCSVSTGTIILDSDQVTQSFGHAIALLHGTLDIRSALRARARL